MDKLGKLITLEGVWGSGKSTQARLLKEKLLSLGFHATFMHYGPRQGVHEELSQFLDHEPLRKRSGAGGFTQPYHATVDVLLRLCREAYDHQYLFKPALREFDVVILDRCIDTILAYSLAVLKEQYSDAHYEDLFQRLKDYTDLWSLEPNKTFFIDVPWPLARERANARGTKQSLERLVFMPLLDDAWRFIIKKEHHRIYRVPAGNRNIEDILAEITRESLKALEP